MEGIRPVDSIGGLIWYSFELIEIEVVIVSSSVRVFEIVDAVNRAPFDCDSFVNAFVLYRNDSMG